jgi:hypothetical protein
VRSESCLSTTARSDGGSSRNTETGSSQQLGRRSRNMSPVRIVSEQQRPREIQWAEHGRCVGSKCVAQHLCKARYVKSIHPHFDSRPSCRWKAVSQRATKASLPRGLRRYHSAPSVLQTVRDGLRLPEEHEAAHGHAHRTLSGQTNSAIQASFVAKDDADSMLLTSPTYQTLDDPSAVLEAPRTSLSSLWSTMCDSCVPQRAQSHARSSNNRPLIRFAVEEQARNRRLCFCSH